MSTSLSAGAAIARARLRTSHDQTWSRGGGSAIGERHGRLDAFLVMASVHLAAVESVLVRVARQHVSRAGAAELDRSCHALQLALRSMHARLYGSSQLMRVPWHAICEDVDHHLESLLAVEESICAELDSAMSADDVEGTVRRIQAAELHGPTRPHPHLPRRGLPGRLARRLASWTDAFWDDVQGRVITFPVLVPTDSTTAGSAT